MSRLILFWFPIIVWFRMTTPADAQDLKILTRVYSRQAEPGGAPHDEQRAVSLTIFHAGRVYDYVDSIGEIIVFEPTENRFTIMSSTRSLVAVVDFDELRQILKIAKTEAEKHIDRLVDKNGGTLPPSAAGLVAQFSPQFEETWKPQSNELLMTSPSVSYRALCIATDDQTLNDSYLHYADWIARLNFALHPQSMYPEARIRLNEALRRRQLIPVEVHLIREGETLRHLRAEHKITWKLDATDRSLIHEWSSRLAKGQLQQVTFAEYQKALMLSAQTR